MAITESFLVIAGKPEVAATYSKDSRSERDEARMPSRPARRRSSSSSGFRAARGRGCEHGVDARQHHGYPAIHMRGASLIVLAVFALQGRAEADTTATVYTYNADGALTSITETTEGRSGSKTTYFTWDNFEADPSSPSTGTVTAANGNLISMGTVPGDDSLSSWRYDNLDRLVRATNHPDDTAALYEYHPDELLAASLNAKAPSSDGLQHYYDQARYPQVANLYDRHTGELSSRHHRIRYLEDGTEQMLVRHRKDVDGVYTLGDQTMSGYAYDPYGASLEPELTGSPPAGPLYSVRNNPYRYSNELRDPVSGADYLRARWYLPGHQTFLQRDPAPNLNRYGYANGNPISNYDPSGRNAKAFFSSLGQGFLHTPMAVLSMFGGEVVDKRVDFSVGVLKSFWENPVNDMGVAVSFLFTPAATEFAADVNILFFGGGGDDAIARGLRLKHQLMQLVQFGAQDLALPAGTVLAQRALSHQARRESFADEFGTAVGMALGMRVAGIGAKTGIAMLRSLTSYVLPFEGGLRSSYLGRIATLKYLQKMRMMLNDIAEDTAYVELQKDTLRPQETLMGRLRSPENLEALNEMGRKGIGRQQQITLLRARRDGRLFSRAILKHSLKTGIRFQDLTYNALLLRLFVSTKELDAASETLDTIDQMYRGQPADRPE